MSLDFGVFALRQMLNSLAVIGPLLMITGLSFYVFRESGKSMRAYLVLGFLCTLAGAFSLIQELKREQGAQHFSQQQMEHLKVEPAGK